MYVLPGFSEPVELAELITASSFLVGGALLGWMVQKTIIRRLKRQATITTWGGDEIVIAAIRDIAMVSLTVGGAFGALSVLPLNRRLEDGLETLLIAALIVAATVIAARLAADVIKLYSLRTTRTMRSSSIFVNLARIIVGIIGLLVLLQTFGVSVMPLLTALGVGGLAVALALQDTLANFFAGLQIIATKKVKPGDFVRLEGGQEGYVVDIDWRHTSIRQLPNNMLLVPNAQLVNSSITNYYYPERETSVLVDVGVDYASDLTQVERVTVDAASDVVRRVPGGIPEFEPFIRYHTFNDSSIDFTVILRVREYTDKYLLTHEFVKQLHDRYREEGIVIPFPIRTLDWKDGRSIDGGNAVRARGANAGRR